MEMLRHIQSDLLDQEVALSTILRKAKVLASQLRSEELGKWVSQELRSAQLWYEEYYVTEGLDRLISYLMTVEMVIGNIHTNPDLSALKLESIPYEAITRMQILLRRRDFVPLSMLFAWLPRYRDNKRFVDAVYVLAHGLQYNLNQLRQELLRLAVHHKLDVYKVADNRRVAEELVKIEQIMNTAFFVINPILLGGPQPQRLEPAAEPDEHNT